MAPGISATTPSPVRSTASYRRPTYARGLTIGVSFDISRVPWTGTPEASRSSGFVESHHSLAEDFEVSTPTLDALVARLCAAPGVHGARLTGAGFGGCVVAVTDPGALREGWHVRAASRATRREVP